MRQGSTHGRLLAVAVVLTLLLARLDDVARSFRDVTRLESVPAFIGCTILFYLLLLGLTRCWRLLRRSRA